MQAGLLSRRRLHVLAGVYFLALVSFEVYDALMGMGTASFVPSVSALDWLVSLGLVAGLFVVFQARFFPWRSLAFLFLVATLVALGSGYYESIDSPGGDCGLGTVRFGFPLAWTWSYWLSNDSKCPAPLLPLLIPGSSLLIFLLDVLFYMAAGISVLELSTGIRRWRTLGGLEESRTRS